MKRLKLLAVIAAILLLLTACKSKQADTKKTDNTKSKTKVVKINLSDDKILVDGESVSDDTNNAVYTKNDIIYYESGKDFTYGEGSEKDAHSKEEADAHKVVHITKSGTYELSGTLSKGQIAVDLGDNTKENPDAVITLILNNASINCDVAPAVIFYNVYECADSENASKDVDTSKAGANVIISDGTTNTINGSYVERIYKPDTVVLNSDNTAVEDADKLHKYDGAFYSKMSMNINGGKKNSGVLNINAENEGLDSEMHLTINGGNININSGNDGINTNEDGISVTTINNGTLKINVTGETGEGDGIDSNGWLVINSGTVIANACSDSADAGIDSDMGIHINGGTVIASGHMLDRIEDGGQTYAVFNFSVKQKGGNTINLTNADSDSVIKTTPANDYVLIISSPQLTKGTYSLYSNDKQLEGVSGGMFGGHGGGMTPPQGMETPEGMDPPQEFETREGMEPPEGFEKPEGMEPPQEFEKPKGMEPPEGFEKPEGMEPPQGERPQKPDMDGENFNPDNTYGTQEPTTEFIIRDGANMFANVGYKE